MPTQKSLDQLLAFPISTGMQKIILFHMFILQIVNFRVLSPDWAHPFLHMSTPKIFNYLLICINLWQHAKKLVNFISSFLRYSNLDPLESTTVITIIDLF